MKRKRVMTIWLILIVAVLSFMGISYAAYTNVLMADFNLSTSNMSFIFDKDDSREVTVHLENEAGEPIKDLGGRSVYEDKKLTIRDIGPIDISDLQDGNAIITIKYAIKTEEKEHGIKRPAAIETKKDSGYDLGIVEFELMSDTPVWSINNGVRNWGNSSRGISRTPDIIYDYLPDSLAEFHVYHTLLPHREDGVMMGTLKLEQVDSPNLPKKMEIGLSSLDFPQEICNEIKRGSSDSILEIEGTYGFSIPLDLNQFNTVQ
ncbi:MAG: hypothetical protein PHV71_06705 [Eubacteriales bacterium]|nr:hypothetical protein [Eubacteriales bacterium]MDD3200340.1 hypothetical protein [Eubacteriales bacterium]MDD4121728.1 hypothetical protein [Eubacteriales bacterium]MDD4630261.1 hypothetical protein [Eubacteriales bacterium]